MGPMTQGSWAGDSSKRRRACVLEGLAGREHHPPQGCRVLSACWARASRNDGFGARHTVSVLPCAYWLMDGVGRCTAGLPTTSCFRTLKPPGLPIPTHPPPRQCSSGRILEVLWFQAPAMEAGTAAGGGGPVAVLPRDGRCLLRYASGAVKQSAVPPGEPRVLEAIREHGAVATYIPLEPR